MNQGPEANFKQIFVNNATIQKLEAVGGAIDALEIVKDFTMMVGSHTNFGCKISAYDGIDVYAGILQTAIDVESNFQGPVKVNGITIKELTATNIQVGRVNVDGAFVTTATCESIFNGQARFYQGIRVLSEG